MVRRRPKKIRISLDISPDLDLLLERLAAERATTKSEILRRAIALADVVVGATKRGQRIGLVDVTGRLMMEIASL